MKNDKLKHYIVGSFFGLLTFPIAFGTGFTWAAVISLICGSIIFVGKEMYDERKKYPTGFDKVDLLSDYLGWCSGWIVSFIIYHLIQMFK